MISEHNVRVIDKLRETLSAAAATAEDFRRAVEAPSHDGASKDIMAIAVLSSMRDSLEYMAYGIDKIVAEIRATAQ